MKEKKKEILLDAGAVDALSEDLMETMLGLGIRKKNAIQTRYAAEAVLLAMYEHFPEPHKVTTILKREYGNKVLLIRYEGEEYNPLDNQGNQWMGFFLPNYAPVPTWMYRDGANELRLRLPKSRVKKEVILLSAVLLAVALGLLQPVIPDAVEGSMKTYILEPVEKGFLGLLTTFAGITVFLSLVTGICGVGTVSEFGKIGKRLVLRFIGLTFVGSAIAAAVMIPFFSFIYGSSGGEGQGQKIMDLIIGIIPKNPITPFMEGNMLQIVVMAVIVGGSVLALSKETKDLQRIFIQMKNVSLYALDLVCGLLALYITASLTLLFWKNGVGVLEKIWKPILVGAVVGMALMVGKILMVAAKCKTRPGVLMRKTFPAFIIGLSTSSTMAAFSTMLETNEKKLGVPAELTNFGLPLASITCCSTMSVGLITLIYFLMEYNQIPVSVGWFIMAWLIITILTFALPPVCGGTLVLLGVLMAQFSIPESCQGIAVTLSLILDFFMTAARVVIIQMELVLQAEYWGTLKKDVLRE